jgi:ribonucleoside-diphosphate reductase alpha chain
MDKLQDANLFSIIDSSLEDDVKHGFYNKVLENRHRPDGMPEQQQEPVILPKERIETTSMQPKKETTEVPQQLTAYSHEEVLAAATVYFKGDTLAANVWMNKYALKDSDGNIYERTPDDMHHRLASEVARIERKYPNPMSEEEIFELFRDFRYIVPQGSPMAGIGNRFQVSSLSNCFVIGGDNNQDSYGAIMKVDEEQVQLMKRRGGVGHDLSHIRPSGSPVKNSALSSTGIVPFMERYSNSTRKLHRMVAAETLMLSISIKHPIRKTSSMPRWSRGSDRANVSVKIDDEFMRAVKENGTYRQQYPVESSNPMKIRRLKPGSSGIRSSTTHGSQPNRACCSGIPLSGKPFPTAIRPGIQDPVDESMRRNTALSLRQLPPACIEPLQLR